MQGIRLKLSYCHCTVGCFKLRYIILKYSDKKCLDLCLCPFRYNACFRDISKQTRPRGFLSRRCYISYFAELTLNLRFVQSALLLGHVGQRKGGIISSTTSFQVLPPPS